MVLLKFNKNKISQSPLIKIDDILIILKIKKNIILNIYINQTSALFITDRHIHFINYMNL